MLAGPVKAAMVVLLRKGVVPGVSVVFSVWARRTCSAHRGKRRVGGSKCCTGRRAAAARTTARCALLARCRLLKKPLV